MVVLMFVVVSATAVVLVLVMVVLMFVVVSATAVVLVVVVLMLMVMPTTAVVCVLIFVYIIVDLVVLEFEHFLTSLQIPCKIEDRSKILVFFESLD
jgi:hypothetical protein